MAVLCVSIAINVWQCSHKPEEYVVIKRDTVWRDTTIYHPQPAETINTGRVVYIKVAVPQPQTQHDTIHDSIEVPILLFEEPKY